VRNWGLGVRERERHTGLIGGGGICSSLRCWRGVEGERQGCEVVAVRYAISLQLEQEQIPHR
jgi:hypothetical protein